MKKLMVVACTIALAAISQAASVSWEATGFPKPTGCSKTTPGKGDVAMYVWEFTAQTWNTDYETAGGIWNAVKGGTLDLGDAYYKAGTATAQPKTTGGTSWDEGDMVYAAVLFLHSDDKKFNLTDATFYMENYASAKASNAGATVQKLGTITGGAVANLGSTSWQAVPEPTSAMLMLLGMAGLALRRRRA